MERKDCYFETTGMQNLKVKAIANTPHLKERSHTENMHKICTKLKEISP